MSDLRIKALSLMVEELRVSNQELRETVRYATHKVKELQEKLEALVLRVEEAKKEETPVTKKVTNYSSKDKQTIKDVKVPVVKEVTTSEKQESKKED